VGFKLPHQTFHGLSHFKFNDDDPGIAILQEMGRQEDLLEDRKLLKSISTSDNPAPTRKREGSEQGFNTKFQKKNENKAQKENTAR